MKQRESFCSPVAVAIAAVNSSSVRTCISQHNPSAYLEEINYLRISFINLSSSLLNVYIATLFYEVCNSKKFMVWDHLFIHVVREL